MATPETIHKCVWALYDAWNRDIREDAVFDAYEIALGDLPDVSVQAGVARAIRAGGSHPPSAGEIRKLCEGESKEDLTALAHAAFVRADRAARRGGVDFNPRKLNDPLLMHAIGAVGGWRLFCEQVDEWQQRNFVAAYIDAASNKQLEHVAQLSFNGKPIGALQDLRGQLAGSLQYRGVDLPRKQLEHRDD